MPVPPAFLFVVVFELVRPTLLLPLLLLAVFVLVVEGVEVFVLVVEGVEVFVFTGRLVLLFPLFAFSVVHATLKTRSVNTARAKTFLIIVSFKAAASSARRIREASRQKYIPYSSAKILAPCKFHGTFLGLRIRRRCDRVPGENLWLMTVNGGCERPVAWRKESTGGFHYLRRDE